MKTSRLVLIVGLAMSGIASSTAADLNVIGNITATGTIDSDGNTTSFGAQSTSVPTQPGVVFTYSDNSVDTFKTLINRNPASWLWVHNSSVPAMRLDSGHNLLLYPLTANLATLPSISLSPATSGVGAALSLGNATGTQTTAPQLTLGSATLSSVGTTTALSTNGALTIAGNLTNSNASAVTSFMGNVGIKTSTPDKSLHVSFDSATIPAVKIGSGTDSQGWYTFLGNDTAGATTSYIGNAYNNDAAAFQIRMKGTAAASARLTVLGNGNVGIGTNNPVARLQLGNNTYGALPANTEIALQGGKAIRFMGTDGNGDYGAYFSTSYSTSTLLTLGTRHGAGDTAALSIISGNVGIGTTSPASKLSVSVADSDPSVSAANSIAAVGSAKTTAIGANSTYGWLQSYSAPLYINNAGNNTILNGAGAGNVGIGSPSPLTKLDVKLATNQHVGIYNNGGVTTLSGLNDSGSLASLKTEGSPLAFGGAGGVEHMRIDSTGRIGIGTSSPGAALDVIKPGNANVYENGIRANRPDSQGQYAFMGYGQMSADAYFGSVYTGTAGQYGRIHLRQYANDMIARDALNIDTAGNVGIGTTSPATALDVRGVISTDSPVNGAVTAQLGRSSTDSGFLNLFTGGASTTFIATNQPSYFNGGNVGIGTTGPAEKLEINGNVNLTSNGQYYRTDVYSRLWTPGQSIGSAVYIGQYGPTLTYNAKYSSGWKLIAGGVASSLGMAEGRLVYSNSNSGNGGDAITWSDRLVVEPNGNVGIGTTAPNEPLEIAGAGRMFLGDGGGASRKGLLVDAVEDGTYVRLHAYDYGTTSSLNLVINPYGGGNVGIGTTNPTQKLSVNGTIRAKEIIVDTNWADYVFDANYRLAPLSEIESHIKTEKHLPGIPSAQEIAEHGVSMGDMQSKLLSKIEELTLHMIAQEKLMSAQQNEIAALRQQVGELKAAGQP